MRKGVSLILSAPSGAGKTTICKALRGHLPDLKFAVSHTTRDMRKGEVEGVDYFFVSQNDFEAKINNKELLEWAKVHDRFYGTSFQSAENPLNNGYDTLLELDIQGVKALRDMEYLGIYILIFPPSIEELESRLRKRGTDTEEHIQLRINTGKKEIKKYKMYDYVLTNYVVEDTVNFILAILQAEKSRAHLYTPTSNDIKDLLQNGVD
jgi:guanylate kinase